MSKVYGNTEAVKKSLLEYMESFTDLRTDGSFLPGEVLEMMKMATVATKREVAVFIDRHGIVQAVGIGDAGTVSLEGFTDARRGEKRLSGVRIWHTHPDGAPLPSAVDISSLKTSRFDAMGVVAVNTEKETISGLSATLLKRDGKGNFNECTTYGVLLPSEKVEFDKLFGEIKKIDAEGGDFVACDVKQDAEKCILVGVITPDTELYADENPLAELAELAKTAGAVVTASFVQKRPTFDSKYYIGKGLAETIALKRQATGATLVIVDDAITASTARNLEDVLGARVIDRTALILDIFAQRAKSREGKLQVELAQQKYLLPRLIGMGGSLSRLGGGIGTRGPGESKLTSDRNHIRRRIAFLQEELSAVETNRSVLRKERQKNGVPVVAVVGYTNAGKSTLINALCNADVFAEDMLFATLDPSVRKLVTEEKKDFLLVDTVGFIKKLPHELVEAFKSTLEELQYADLLIHVVDGSSEKAGEQIQVVDELIENLGAADKPKFLVVNKTDKGKTEVNAAADKTIFTSAKTGEGLDKLRQAIIDFFSSKTINFNMLLPYNAGNVLSYIHDFGTIDSEEYCENGVKICGNIDEKLWKKAFEEYLI